MEIHRKIDESLSAWMRRARFGETAIDKAMLYAWENEVKKMERRLRYYPEHITSLQSRLEEAKIEMRAYAARNTELKIEAEALKAEAARWKALVTEIKHGERK